ncbi:phage tail protein, partial [Acinetobacter baumannii]|nr:phage tail protein [Acinetobacter baumannii]
MDLLIEKESQATRLSDFGIYNIAIEDSAPLLSVSH